MPNEFVPEMHDIGPLAFDLTDICSCLSLTLAGVSEKLDRLIFL